ncbi:hypothetical protein [Ktedonospora formicarum]|uniref:Uncharacterized protein n=1 Tax=Ktedonospora formicarum TaxID=2778364 RepID=A0A8J3HU66_9CHLR|nr:hypothetical protein [Ktedonospora formicarum]GHO42046.1 hypothetical protein KSX_02090 [Ktedonospora formicarum]
MLPQNRKDYMTIHAAAFYVLPPAFDVVNFYQGRFVSLRIRRRHP